MASRQGWIVGSVVLILCTTFSSRVRLGRKCALFSRLLVLYRFADLPFYRAPAPLFCVTMVSQPDQHQRGDDYNNRA